MKKRLIPIAIAVIFFLNFGQSQSISPALLQEASLHPNEKIDVVIMLQQQVPLAQLVEKVKHAGRQKQIEKQIAFKQMADLAKQTQPSMVNWLHTEMGFKKEEIRKYWILNALGVHASYDQIVQIAASNKVLYVSEQPEFEPAITPEKDRTSAATFRPNDHEQGHDVINAPALWAMGYTGYGTKVYVYDTGIDIEHPALRSNFSYHNNPLEVSWLGKSEEPYVCTDHGSHVAGTILGLDRVRNDTIGVAFNAQYMMTPQFTSCASRRNDNLATWQWVMDPDGDPNTNDELPQAVNMSGGSQVSSNICGSFMIESLLLGLQLGDIAAVFSAGNSGPGPMTNGSPALHNLDLVHAFSVGNLNANTFDITSSSSRGPSHCSSPEEALFIKPEVSAPGTQVRSSIRDGQYARFTGTSMAAPHTTGAFLLLREAFPFLSEGILLESLYYSAVDYGEPGEDNTFGRGVIDVLAAFNWLIDQGHEAAPPLSNEYDVLAVDMALDQDTYCDVAPRVSILFENAGTETIFSVKINFKEESNHFEGFSKTWNGVLAPDQLAEMEFEIPIEMAVGKHELTMSLDIMDNNNEVRTLNNQFKQRFRVFEDKPFEVALAYEATNEVCEGSRLLLSSQTELDTNQELNWYVDNIGILPVAKGNQYLTPPIVDDHTYFATLETNYFLGKNLENASIDFGEDIKGGMVFDVDRPLKIERFKVNSGATGGGRMLQLFNQFDEPVRSKFLSVPAGEHMVEVNWTINEPGKGYRLVMTAGKPFAHATDAPEYPYHIDNMMTIQSGLYDGELRPNEYYYFFDWEISATHPCGPEKIEVFVRADTVAPLEIVAPADTVYLSDGGLVDLYASDEAFSNYEWFLGNGLLVDGQSVTAEYFEPGTFTISLHATNENGCTTNAEKTITVVNDLQTSIEDEGSEVKNMIKVFPNPASEKIYIQISPGAHSNEIVDVSMFDLLGRKVMNRKMDHASGFLELDISTLASGQYVIHMLNQNVMVILE